MLEQALDAFQRGDLPHAEATLLQLWQLRQDAAVAALQGQVLRGAGRWMEAIMWFQNALEADPADSRPRLAIGQVLREQGDLQASRACFEQVVLQAGVALAMGPDQPMRWLELGLAYAELGQPDDAIPALEASFKADPTQEAHEALTRLLAQQGRIYQAACYHAAMARLQPTRVTPRLNLAICHHLGGDSDEGLRLLETLLCESPHDHRVRQTFLFLSSTAGASWLELRREVARAHWLRLAPAHGVQLTSHLASSLTGPLRVGILTADPGTHPVSFFLESFLRHHDRSALQVELVEVRPGSGSRDQSLRRLAHASLLLPAADEEVQRALIRERSFDVILETSGVTPTSGLPLLAERLAPVQCHYVGFHASTFLPTIDWFIADPVLLPPELEHQFSERIWRLARPWAAYTPPEALPPGHSLAEGEPPVFGSCNQIAKIGPATLRYWAAALLAVPQAQLLVKHRHTADPQVRERIISALAAAGVDPGRVRFEGWAADWTTHMDTYNRIDVALDATPWSSATTAFEALAMGTPLVAIRGATMAGRMSCAALEGFGEPGWIADTPEEFAALARALVADLPVLRSLRAARQQRALGGALFSAEELSKALATALVAMFNYATSPVSVTAKRGV